MYHVLDPFIDIFVVECPAGKTKWIKINNNGTNMNPSINLLNVLIDTPYLISPLTADDTEWEKDFGSVPETDGEIPVMVVPKKRNDELEKVEDQQKKNVDSVASLIKKLTEEANK